MVILGAERGFQVCLSGRVEAAGWATRLGWLLLWWWLSPWACRRRHTVVGPRDPPSPFSLRGPQFLCLWPRVPLPAEGGRDTLSEGPFGAGRAAV